MPTSRAKASSYLTLEARHQSEDADICVYLDALSSVLSSCHLTNVKLQFLHTVTFSGRVSRLLNVDRMSLFNSPSVAGMTILLTRIVLTIGIAAEPLIIQHGECRCCSTNLFAV